LTKEILTKEILTTIEEDDIPKITNYSNWKYKF
jgi:hypothetical protein